MDPKLAEWLGLDPDATSLTLKLPAPVEFGAKTYDQITLTEPTLGQEEEAAQKPAGIGQDIALISIVGKVPETVAKALSSSSYRKAVAFFGVFMTAGPSAPATSSD